MRSVEEIRKQIAELEVELYEVAPFMKTEKMANKAFGEWSEEYVVSKTTSIIRSNGMGKDLFSPHWGTIEVKSTRNPSKFTFNQIKPEYSDFHLFITYDLEKGEESLFLVPSSDLSKFTMSKQHNYSEEGNCFTLSSTAKNKQLLETYRVSWEELNG